MQDRGLILTLLDLDPSREGAVESLATNLVLPSNADSIAMDGQVVDTKSPFKKEGTAKSVIAVREGNAISVLRIFEADGEAGKSQFVLQGEKDGLKYNALRYTAYHYQGESQKLAEKHVRVGILAYTATCNSDKQCAEVIDRVKSARIESGGDAHIWTVKVRVGNTELDAARDLDRRTILSRHVDGKLFAAPYPLSINGKPVELR